MNRFAARLEQSKIFHEYPHDLNHPSQSDGRTEAIAASFASASASRVLAPAARNAALTFDHIFSMGLRSGL